MSKGFTNLGNTCYMNSALQCLSHLECLSYESQPFIDDRRKRSAKNDYGLMIQWLKIQQEMWDNTNNNVIHTGNILREFIRLCQKENIYFESFQQNDASDFINIFMDLLHGSIKRKVNIEVSGTPVTMYDNLKVKSIQKWSSFFENSYSYIIQNFYSQILSITSCPECKYVTTNHDPMLVITLTLSDNTNTLDDCIQEFISENQLDKGEEWKCDQCKKKVCPHKKTNFWKLSPVLIFQINQYRNGKKINKYIEYNETLPMKNYCLSTKKELSYNYKLSGICIHSGGLNGGHYYAMCKNYKTDEWNIHDDSSVHLTTIDNVLQETPYCFFYVME
jgi:ubiquitin C-terminal hydrolase